MSAVTRSRNLRRGAVVLWWLCFLVLSFLVFGKSDLFESIPGGPPAATVQASWGSAVSWRMQDSSLWRKAAVGQNLPNRSVVASGPRGRIHLRLTGGRTLVLGPETQVVLVASTRSEEGHLVTLLKGEVVVQRVSAEGPRGKWGKVIPSKDVPILLSANNKLIDLSMPATAADGTLASAAQVNWSPGQGAPQVSDSTWEAVMAGVPAGKADGSSALAGDDDGGEAGVLPALIAPPPPENNKEEDQGPAIDFDSGHPLGQGLVWTFGDWNDAPGLPVGVRLMGKPSAPGGLSGRVVVGMGALASVPPERRGLVATSVDVTQNKAEVRVPPALIVAHSRPLPLLASVWGGRASEAWLGIDEGPGTVPRWSNALRSMRLCSSRHPPQGPLTVRLRSLANLPSASTLAQALAKPLWSAQKEARPRGVTDVLVHFKAAADAVPLAGLIALGQQVSFERRTQQDALKVILSRRSEVIAYLDSLEQKPAHLQNLCALLGCDLAFVGQERYLITASSTAETLEKITKSHTDLFLLSAGRFIKVNQQLLRTVGAARQLLQSSGAPLFLKPVKVLYTK